MSCQSSPGDGRTRVSRSSSSSCCTNNEHQVMILQLKDFLLVQSQCSSGKHEYAETSGGASGKHEYAARIRHDTPRGYATIRREDTPRYAARIRPPPVTSSSRLLRLEKIKRPAELTGSSPMKLEPRAGIRDNNVLLKTGAEK